MYEAHYLKFSQRCETKMQYICVCMHIYVYIHIYISIKKNKYLHIFLLTPVILDKFICETGIQQDSVNQICIA